MSEKEFIKSFIEHSRVLGFGTAYEIPDHIIDEFIEMHKTTIKATYFDLFMLEAKKNPLSNVDMFFAVHNELKDEVWMINKRTMKVVGKMINVCFDKEGE